MDDYLPYNPAKLSEHDFNSLPDEMKYKIIDNYGVLQKILDPNKRIKVTCMKKHTIQTQLIRSFIDGNKWCSACDQNKYNITDLIEHAINKKGLCLSTEYISCKEYYKWKCGSCNHIWNSTWLSVNRKNTWCPNCANSTMETFCRLAIEEITKLKFPKNLDAIGAEIDCYNDDLRLGFEYDGIQHTKYVPYFHGDEDDKKFEQQQQRDEIKDKLCKDAGITLIRIKHTVNKKILRSYIHELIRTHKVKTELDIELATEFISDNEFRDLVAKTRTSKSEQYIAIAKESLESKNHKLISSSCYSRTSELEVICNEGHTYLTNIDNIYRDLGCATCSKKVPVTDECMRNLIESKGYKYISRRKCNAVNTARDNRVYHYVEFECNNPTEPHIIDMLWDNIKPPDKICPECSNLNAAQKRAEKKAIKEAEIESKVPKNKYYIKAKAVGYEIHMDTYVHFDEPVIVTCSKDHVFSMLPSRFRNKNLHLEFCSQCILENDLPNITVLDTINYLEYDVNRYINTKCLCGYIYQISEVCLRTTNKCCKDKKCRFYKCISLDRSDDKKLNIPKTIESMEAEVIKYNELKTQLKQNKKLETENEYVSCGGYLIPGGSYAEKKSVKVICPNKHEFMCTKFQIIKKSEYEYCTQCIIKNSFPFLSYAEEFNFLDPTLENNDIKLICQCDPKSVFTYKNQKIRTLESACKRRTCKFRTDPKYKRSKFKVINAAI